MDEHRQTVEQKFALFLKFLKLTKKKHKNNFQISKSKIQLASQKDRRCQTAFRD